MVASTAEQWFCEDHPDQLMGHDGCHGVGILDEARVPILLNRIRLLKQEAREAGLARDDMVAQMRVAAARAFEIADEAMFELLLAHGVLHGNGVDSTVIGFTNEDAAEVMSLADASGAMRDAFDWLKDRGYVVLDRDGEGEFVSVIRRPGEDC